MLYVLATPRHITSTSFHESRSFHPMVAYNGSTYEVATPPKRKEEIELTDIKEQLLARHRDWKSPYDSQAGNFFKQIIELGCCSESLTFDPGCSRSCR
jgi:hypothetical protein